MLEEIFDEAFERFLQEERALLLNDASERAWCCRLAMKLEDSIRKRKMRGYYADSEYNRNHGDVKTIIGRHAEVLNITTDIIVHSRGENFLHDNLIVIEMKKSSHPPEEKQKDRERLIVMTRPSMHENALPKHVSGYELGVFVEIDTGAKHARIEIFENGAFRNAFEKAF
jgi:hypothetical protein